MDTESDGPAPDLDRAPRIMRLLATNGRVAWQVVGILVAIGLLGFVFSRIKLILLAAFVAVVVAAIVEPIAVWMEGRGLGRRAATSIGLVLVLVALAGAATLMGYRMVDELPGLAENVEARKEEVLETLSREPLSLSEDEVTELLHRGTAAMGSTTSAPEPAAPDGVDSGEAAHSSATATGQGATQEDGADDGEGPSPDTTFLLLMTSAEGLRLLGFGLVGVVLSFFLVRDRDQIVDGVVHQLAGGDHDRSARRILTAAWHALDGYVRASVTVGGVEAVIIAVVVLLVQQFDGHVLQPTIVAANTQLHPIATILALLVGGLVGGLLGALLEVPVAAVGVAVVGELVSPAPT